MFKRRFHCSAAVAALALLVAAPLAHAEIIPAYFGWNYVSDSGAAPGVLDLTGFTYVGGFGIGELITLPAFAGQTGMPDAAGASNAPSYTGGGDGESTRTIGQALPIDWVPAGTPLLGHTYAFPTIAITEFSVATPGPDGTLDGNYAGFDSDYYVVGLIPNAPAFGPPYAQPIPEDDELASLLPAPQGDIYTNPQATAFNDLAPYDGLAVIFAAAAIPEPAALAMFLLGVAGLGLAVRRRI